MSNLIGFLLTLILAACSPGVAISDGQITTFPPASDFLVMTDGEKLALHTWLPGTDPDAVVIALHGFNDYSRAFSIPAPYLAARGIAVYTYDQRGHGSSPQRGRWPGLEVLAGDAREAIQLIGDRHQGLPVYILGESMGGAVAVIALTEGSAPEVAGLILVAPAVRGGRHINRFYRAILYVGKHLTPALTLSGRWSGVTLSDNREAVDVIRSDPLVVQKSRFDTLNGIVDLMDEALEASSKLHHPILLLYGLNDEIVSKSAVCDFLALPAEKPVTVFYPKGYHLLLRDRQRDIVLRDITAWLMAPDAPLPSGLGYSCE